MLWHSTKPEIQDWVDFKALEFAQEERKGSRLNPTEWLGWYFYTCIHDIFFFELPILLHEWLSKLATQQIYFQGREPTEWNPQLIRRLKSVSNFVSRVVDFWVNNILQGYITEFVVDMVTSYSEEERKLFQGLRGRYLSFLKTWIKMLICKKWILRMWQLEELCT